MTAVRAKVGLPTYCLHHLSSYSMWKRAFERRWAAGMLPVCQTVNCGEGAMVLVVFSSWTCFQEDKIGKK